MNPVLLFLLIVVFGIIPFGVLIIRVLYKHSIVFKMALLVFLSSMFCAVVAYAVCYYGLKSLTWAIPVSLVILLVGNILTRKAIQKPIIKLRERIDDMAKGKFTVDDNKAKHKNDEIGAIFKSFNILEERMHNTALFADAIANKNFDHDFQVSSEDDELGLALLNMRNDLKIAEAAEKERIIEQEKATWAATGIAEFSELFRQETSNLEGLSRVFISKLVDYVGVIQGGVFILNDDDPEHIKFQLQGAVAYDRTKYIEKEFELGIGLVGQCAFEKEPIYLNEIPNNYLEITSGLGESNPRFVLLVPAILNDKVYAVIELASFTKIEKYKTQFIQKIGEALASTLSMVKINLSTAKLLEESKDRAGQLAEQSEALKQNYEELQATQEDLARKEAELNELARQLKGED